MSHFLPEPPLPSDRQNLCAVILMNLGTPKAPTAAAVRPYLREFLSDKRVVELPHLLWMVILNGLILPFRSGRTAHAYSRIWQQGGSPLAIFTERQVDALQKRLPEFIVCHAMTYGEPSASTVLAQLKAKGVGRVLLIPLYPQYAASSTGAAVDKILSVLQRQRNQVSLRTVNRFYNHPAYIDAMAEHIRCYWQEHGKSRKLLLSFHGVPESTYRLGDPYPDECRSTARLLAEALGLGEEDYITAFQSQFGKGRWVGPSTQDLLDTLPQQGCDEIDIFCPGFLSDCLETLEEIAIMGREQFHEAGGKRYQFIPCLNDSSACLTMLETLVRENTYGWQAT